MQLRAYSVFHLNLAFSSISEEARPEVVERCYHPLLDLVESVGLPLGIELTGWTLERVHEIDPGWVERLEGLLHDGRCELIGSGRTQLIGPLAPYAVNVWNQRLGMEIYERRLDTRPRIALVNEMAFSSSLVGIYQEAGYEGLIVDRDNVRLALGLEDRPVGDTPTHALGPGGETLPVLWSDSILFQKLQHFAHGDIRQSDYLDYLRGRIESGERLLPLYMNDAEVFDYRPGRFGSESPVHPDGEWHRIERVLAAATEQEGLEWCSPSEALVSVAAGSVSSLVSASYPIPVKKQAKYNLARWAVTGRNDTWINTMCHRLSGRLVTGGAEEPEHWARLCDLWATDLRTHITEERWERARRDVAGFADELNVAVGYPQPAPGDGSPDVPAVDGIEVIRDDEGILLEVRTGSLRLALNLRRGLTVHSLGFASHEFTAAVGTIPHGFFSTIALGADFYSGGVVVELPGERRRITDLERVDPMFEETDVGLLIRARIPTPLGPINKTIGVSPGEEAVTLRYDFPDWDRPLGTIRAGTLTLMPGAFQGPIRFECANGGSQRETFVVDGPVDHTRAISSLISSNAGLGATTGSIVIGDERRRVKASWNPGVGAVFPMLSHQPSHPGALTRLFFSLQELDDTARAGGPVASLGLRVSADVGPYDS